MPEFYTLFVCNGRIGTYSTEEKAEEIKKKIESDIRNLTHIQKWTPIECEPAINDDDELTAKE